jgi:4-carboxymuconolactone decarboxylase
MDKERFDKGLEVRAAVLRKDYVETSMKNANDFNRPFQELVTEYRWGAAWGREGLSRRLAACSTSR